MRVKLDHHILKSIANLCNRLMTDVIAHRTDGRSVARKAEAFARARNVQHRVAA